jgi:hypothetical protein
MTQDQPKKIIHPWQLHKKNIKNMKKNVYVHYNNL